MLDSMSGRRQELMSAPIPAGARKTRVEIGTHDRQPRVAMGDGVWLSRCYAAFPGEFVVPRDRRGQPGGLRDAARDVNRDGVLALRTVEHGPPAQALARVDMSGGRREGGV
jgi:hypothetical protein